MKRFLPGLHLQTPKQNSKPDEIYLVRVERARHRYHFQKPFLELSLIVVEPREFCGRILSGRLYCTPRALWKLRWFLRDFGYDSTLLEQDEVDAKRLVGLQGVAKISYTAINGDCYLNFAGFAPVPQWQELQAVRQQQRSESR